MNPIFLPECTEHSHCNDLHKNTCNTVNNECECNTGFNLDQGNCICVAGEVDQQGMCNPCLDNQKVNSEGKCEDCPAGKEPSADRDSCMDCPDDEISPNGICMMCTDPTKVPNNAMTACVGMLNLIISNFQLDSC